MAKSNADKVRSAAERHVAARGKRYEPGLREQARAHAERRRRDGLSWQTIAAELGVRGETLRRWCVERTAAAALRPVEIVAPEDVVPDSTVSAIVTSSTGLRIEGLSLAEVIALVRAVG